MATTMECANQIDGQIFVFQMGIILSATVTVGVSVGAVHCLRVQLLNMATRARFYRNMGITKLILAAGLFVMLPTCPERCTCTSFDTYYFYPIVAILIGIQWLSEAVSAAREANEPIQYAVALPVEETEKDQELGGGGFSGGEAGQTITKRSSTAVHNNMLIEDYKDIPICDSILV